MIDLVEIFNSNKGEFLKFELVHNKSSTRRDLCAFIMLDKLVPDPDAKIVSAAEHDQIYLDVDLDKLAAIATSDDIIMLMRCGVMLDSDIDSLTMFV